MKKYAVFVLAVMLVGMSSCAYAIVEVNFKVTGENYVGEEPHAHIVAFAFSARSYSFEVAEGELPP